MDIMFTIYKVLFWISAVVCLLTASFAIYNWFYPMANSNPYSGIIAGIVELGAIGIAIVSGGLAWMFYQLKS